MNAADLKASRRATAFIGEVMLLTAALSPK